MRYAFFILLLILCQANLLSQENFILGKSAKTLSPGSAVFSGEYSVYAFENIKSRRMGLDISYGLMDRLQVNIRGSLSDFPSNNELEFETGGLTAIYRFLDVIDPVKHWTASVYGDLGLLGNLSQSPAEINFDGNSNGFALGVVANRSTDTELLAFSAAYARISLPAFQTGLLNGYALLYHASLNKPLNILMNMPLASLSLLVELAGQFNTDMDKQGARFFNKGSTLDALAGFQITYADQYRVELGLQTELTGNITRFSDAYYHIRLKYLLGW